MFRKRRVEGDIKIFSYDNRNFLVSVNDSNTKKEFKFQDTEYLKFLYQDIERGLLLLNPCLFNITIHQITICSDRQIIIVQPINQNSSKIIIEHQVTYDPITENIFNSIIGLECINLSDTDSLMS